MRYIGYPAEVYAHGIQVLMMTIMGFVCVPLSTVLFVKVFFKLKLTSVYEVRHYNLQRWEIT